MKLKLKYYLRGLGLGIVVTAVIMCIRESKDDKMTDEEIMARAKQLGMIESTVLIESSPNEDDDAQETDNNQEEDISGLENAEEQPQKEIISKLPNAWTNAGTDKQVEQSSAGAAKDSGSGTQSDINMSGDNRQDTQSDADMTADNRQDTQSDADMTETGEQETSETGAVFPKVLIISNGDSSYTVSKKLVEIGAVESASVFDTYLCEHGYDKKIRSGTYTIPVGAADEQIAKIVTGTKITD